MFLNHYISASTMFLILGTSYLHAEADLGKKILNPVSDLINIPFQFDFDNGADNGNANFLNIQPVYPVKFKDWHYVSRLIVPLVDAPGGVPGLVNIPSSEPGERAQGLGDINYSLFLSPAKETPWEWGAGASVTLPTATSKSLGSGKWSAGPTAAVLRWQKWGGTGVMVRQLWSFAGEDDRSEVSQLLIQPFVGYKLQNGWSLMSMMQWTSNWQAAAGNRWTIPVGGGVAKLFKLQGQAINTRLEAYVNVVKPDGAPDWTLRYTFQLLFPK